MMADIFVISTGGELQLGPLQGPLRIGEIVKKVHDNCSCPMPGALPTLILGEREFCPSDEVGGDDAASPISLTLVWKSALTVAILIKSAWQARRQPLEDLLARVGDISLEFDALSTQHGLYDGLDERELAYSEQEDLRAMSECTRSLTKLKADLLNVEEMVELCEIRIHYARWQELLGKVSPVSCALSDETTMAAFNFLAGANASTITLESLSKAADEYSWSEEEVLAMLVTADKDRDGVVNISEFAHMLKASFKETAWDHALTFYPLPVMRNELPVTRERIAKLQALRLSKGN